jgi:hypothetical protein
MSFASSQTVSELSFEELVSELNALIDMDSVDDYILKLSKGNEEDDILKALESQLFNHEVTDV